jgi:hypothetical protein
VPLPAQAAGLALLACPRTITAASNMRTVSMRSFQSYPYCTWPSARPSRKLGSYHSHHTLPACLTLASLLARAFQRPSISLHTASLHH